jgi:hypothetical protein
MKGKPTKERLKNVAKGTSKNSKKLTTNSKKTLETVSDDYKQHTFLGIDGEGSGRRPHVYTYLAYSDESGGFSRDIHKPNTRQALEFLLTIPSGYTVVAFAFGYDLTKILADLPNDKLFQLFRPETREYWSWQAMRRVTKPVRWAGFELNFMAGKFTVKKHRKQTVVWDVFKFFATRFTNALEAWQVETDLEHMKAMKESRSAFDSMSQDEINAYCREECRTLAILAKRLYNAHCEAGLQLKGFYGAGSTGAALLNKLDVKDYRNDGPEEMREELARGFFGGRFENSITGTFKKSVWSYDISSAYPYQCTRLPCLVCGEWRKTTKERIATSARAALIRCEIDTLDTIAWGPFPFRTKKGEITYPHAGTCVVWRDEYLAGKRLYPTDVTFHSAWYLSGECTCGRPYPMADLATVYRERVKLGKEGKGMVLKLGANSVYGKLAQSIGSPQFQSWVWAGMITSGCRAMILDAIGVCKDRHSMLMVATDGIYSAEPLALPKPWDTGTYDLYNHKGKNVPLGGWEEKRYDKGVVCLRPGVYFPVNPTEKELADIRARGLGKSVMAKNWRKAVDALESGKDSVQFPSVQRFVGAVSSVYQTPTGDYRRSDDYGEWIEREIKLSFNPLPKRHEGPVTRDGYKRLVTRNFAGQLTEPYDAALETSEARDLELQTQEILEQPDGDYCYA